MSFIDRRLTRGFRFAAVIFLGLGMVASRKALADINLLTKGDWVVDGTDDTGTNPASINMSVNGDAVGAFSELAVSFNVGGTGVVTVCTIKGNGEIRLALPPPGQFGGSFYTTGYWDCDAGFIPTMTITELNIRGKGGKKQLLEFKGKISNLVSMAAKDFTMTLLPPQSDTFRAELKYSLYAISDFCIDQTNHTNKDDFQVARMAANFVDSGVQQNDEVRFMKVTSKTCFFYGCVSTKKSFCTNLVNQSGFVIDTPPRLGGGTVWLLHTQPLPQETPTLIARFSAPSAGRLRPQGYVTASADPSAQNVEFWADWIDVKASYRNKKRVGKFRYTLEVDSPQALSCDVQD